MPSSAAGRSSADLGSLMQVQCFINASVGCPNHCRRLGVFAMHISMEGLLMFLSPPLGGDAALMLARG
jgi:hypothetical protein